MFGYVKPHVPTLLVKEHEFYRAAYCGLCRSMRKRTGALSAVSLRYDYLLLLLVRMLHLKDESFPVRRRRCVLHPVRRRPMLEENDALRYVTDVSAFLGYHQLKDTERDCRGFKKMGALCIHPIFARARKKATCRALEEGIAKHMQELHLLEQARCSSIDEAAEPFGKLLGEVFAFGLDAPESRVCYEFGYRIGRFIYIADAAQDYEKDVKEKNYNPLYVAYGAPSLTESQKENLYTALTIELREAEGAMNLFPAYDGNPLLHIIQNTVYEGLPRRIAFLKSEPTVERKTI